LGRGKGDRGYFIVGGDLEGFRAQLVIPEQQELFDYWLACCDGARYPMRKSISPIRIPLLLPYVSLIDVEEDSGFRIRLAGTSLRDVFDREITGLTVGELERMSSAGYWHRACACAVETGMPVHGAIKSPRTTKDHLVQFWMRLPLTTSGEAIDQLLGFDICIPAGEVTVDLADCDNGEVARLAV
jgi:hypothetical protein